MEKCSEGKGLRVNVDKTKDMQSLFGKKRSVRKRTLVVFVVIGLVVILFTAQNVTGGFMVVVLMCLGR